jgi:hypothetical protein
MIMRETSLLIIGRLESFYDGTVARARGLLHIDLSRCAVEDIFAAFLGRA